MVSEKFMVNSEAGRAGAAEYAGESFAAQAGLGHRDALRLSLLVEETLGMMRAMVDEFYGQLWLASEGGRCEIHLEATASMDAARRQELLSVSRTGKNTARRGFMNMLGDVISDALYRVGQVIDAYGRETMSSGIVVPAGMETPGVYDVTPLWTLQSYRAGLSEEKDKNAESEQAWDELEKSVVANLADDVIVGIKGDRIEVIIVKQF